MTVYILAPDFTHRFGINRFVAATGFTEMGEDVRLFELADFDDLPLAREDVVVGGVGVVHRAFERLGVPIPALASIPEQLAPFAGRRVWRATMREVRELAAREEAVFAKPAPDRPKLFTGQVFAGFADLVRTAHIADDEPVDCAEPVDFLSEYRGFVLHGELIGLRPYYGDPLVFPDPEIVRRAVASFDPAPAAYALDIGATADGRSLVVEINDGYSIGAYGLTPTRYAQLIAARWAELRATAIDEEG